MESATWYEITLYMIQDNKGTLRVYELSKDMCITGNMLWTLTLA